jgi:hypothetical protein
MACAICEIRKERRFCPGVRGDICTICCGTEREVTVDCPFECVYLQDARKHERQQTLDPQAIPNRDINVSETFLQRNVPLLSFLNQHMFHSAMRVPGMIDYDVREALEALIKTYRTLQSGVYYESRPQNPLAANLYAMLQAGIEEFRKGERENTGMSNTRDADVLGVLCFFQRVEMLNNNGRKRGRAFLDLLRSQAPAQAEVSAQPESRIILP